MKRPARILSMLAAVVLAAPAAMAGNDILKCVDAGGHVTLTDQPCADGAAGVRLEAGSGSTSGSGSETLAGRADAPRVQPQPQRHVLPAADLRHDSWQQPVMTRTAMAQPKALASDVATLKEARRALLMLDARPRLAALN